MQLTTGDGHSFKAYARATDSDRAGLIVIQEIFGLNSHIRSVCDRFAEEGYRVIAPALFDRARTEGDYGVELGYGPEDRDEAMTLTQSVGWVDPPQRDIKTCLKWFPEGMPVGVVGYCWGGALAWLSAQNIEGLDAAVGYYGGIIVKHLEPAPMCPVMLHFGEHDSHIPMEDVEAIRQAYPDLPIFTYDAGHGFNCDARESFQPQAAALALERTLEFLRTHLTT